MRRLLTILWFMAALLISATSVTSQTSDRPTKLALLDLGSTTIAKLAAETLRSGFRATTETQVVDSDLSRAAARGVGYAGSLNMSVVEARNLGAAIDSDFYIIGEAQTLRRSSSQVPVFYESYASVFLISSRSGKLLFWDRPTFQGETPSMAEERLIKHLRAGETTQRCLLALRQAIKDERIERVVNIDSTAPLIEEAPDDDKTAAAQGLRLPRPYRRLRPTYPESAAQAEAEATVDVVVDVGADGEITQVQIARWAGFGLDDSTVATVRQMHFFPAMRNGTPIPMRVLLRYNFRKPAP